MRQRRRGRAGGFDENVHSDGEIYRVGQAVSWQEQVDLAVEIEVPGSWFGVGSMGSLTTTERREKYNAQAVEYSEVRRR